MTFPTIRASELVVLACCILAAGRLLGYPATLTFSPDAHEYLKFSDALLDGQLLSTRGSDVPKALATRTPGYPVCVAAVRLFGLETRSAVSALHALLGLVALIGVPLLLRPACPVWASGPGVLLALYCMREYYPRPITEWLSLVLLLFLFATCVRHVEGPTRQSLLLVGLTASALVLTRPALIAAGLFPLAFGLLRSGESVRRGALVVLVSLSPLLLWMGFNQYRLGSFTLTPFTGPNLFGVAAIVGHATPRAGDDPELAAFIEAINARKSPPPGERLDLENLKRENYDHNIHKLAEPLAEERGLDWMTFNRMLLVYSFRSIGANVGTYLEYVRVGLEKALPNLGLLYVPLTVLPAFWLVKRRHRGLALATLALLGLHLAHMLLCAGMEIMLQRYWTLTSCPLQGAALVLGCVLLLDLGRPAWQRFRQQRA